MCHEAVLNFGKKWITDAVVRGRAVLEIGAVNINGSLRHHCLQFKPSSYIGIDLSPCPGFVDKIMDAKDIAIVYGRESFDLVICTEVLEHVANWANLCDRIKDVLRPCAHLLLTTRSPGFFYHEHPHDYWRFPVETMRKIFNDLHYHCIESDPQAPGVLVFAQRTGLPMERIPLSNIYPERITPP